jgi:hypothetical protein
VKFQGTEGTFTGGFGLQGEDINDILEIYKLFFNKQYDEETVTIMQNNS